MKEKKTKLDNTTEHVKPHKKKHGRKTMVVNQTIRTWVVFLNSYFIYWSISEKKNYVVVLSLSLLSSSTKKPLIILSKVKTYRKINQMIKWPARRRQMVTKNHQKNSCYYQRSLDLHGCIYIGVQNPDVRYPCGRVGLIRMYWNRSGCCVMELFHTGWQILWCTVVKVFCATVKVGHVCRIPFFARSAATRFLFYKQHFYKQR